MKEIIEKSILYHVTVLGINITRDNNFNPPEMEIIICNEDFENKISLECKIIEMSYSHYYQYYLICKPNEEQFKQIELMSRLDLKL